MSEIGTRAASARLPVTERVIGSLRGPVWAWTLAWGALGPLRPLLNAAILWLLGESDAARELLDRNVVVQWVLGYLIVLTIIGTRRLVAQLDAVRPALWRLEGRPATEPAAAIDGLDSVMGPVTIAVVLTVATKLAQLGRYPLAVNAFDALLLVFALLPIATWLWTYVRVLIGLDRLGRQALALEPFPPDRGLGLRPLGGLAFTGVLVIAAGDVPYVVILAREPADLLIGLAIFLVGVAFFILSLWRLHRQMLGAKARYTSQAAALYTEAYAPLRVAHDLDTLAARASLLSAAEGLEKRADGILEWPFDERVLARLVIVVTGVVTAVISTFVLREIGLR